MLLRRFEVIKSSNIAIIEQLSLQIFLLCRFTICTASEEFSEIFGKCC